VWQFAFNLVSLHLRCRTAESLTRGQFFSRDRPMLQACTDRQLARMAKPDHAAGRTRRLRQKPSRRNLGRAGGRTFYDSPCADRRGGARRVGDGGAGGRTSEIVGFRRPCAFSPDESGTGRRGFRSGKPRASHYPHSRSSCAISGRVCVAIPAVSLLPPDDQLFRALIVKFCADRQLAVDETW